MDEIKYKDIPLKVIDFSLTSLIDLFPIEEKLQAYDNPLISKDYQKDLSAIQKTYLEEVKTINGLDIPQDMKDEFIATQGEICKTEKLILERDFKKSIFDNGNLIKEIAQKILVNADEVLSTLTIEDIGSAEFQNTVLKAYQQSFLKKNKTTTT